MTATKQNSITAGSISYLNVTCPGCGSYFYVGAVKWDSLVVIKAEKGDGCRHWCLSVVLIAAQLLVKGLSWFNTKHSQLFLPRCYETVCDAAVKRAIAAKQPSPTLHSPKHPSIHIQATSTYVS